ncbi:MAG: SGNH/GDSL hydrolase family protein [Tannerellaceae bacterium]|jgi:lysophospholipase L1-like esterase|nr:SGNH/GDSL hydrolase family protein [Tannerellaceae bacterium]
MKNSRRDFLKKSVLAGAGALMLPELAKAVVNEQPGVNAPKIALKKDAVVLMQGDSITDAGRTYGNNNCNTQEQLGFGYSLYIAAQLLAQHAGKQLKIYNRGISGNKVYQLRDRWEMECLAFQPEVLSILIGVNDYWHTLTGGYKGTAEVYENDYRALLKYTKEKSPATQLVICEPFALKGGSAIEEEKWFPKFDEYRAIARKLATEFNAVFVPFQAGFDAAMKQAPARYWSYDGVHPDLPGRQLMATIWMEATGL